MRRCTIVGLSLLMLIPALTVAGDRPKRVKYEAPTGFAGHSWGDLRASFPKLPARPIGIGASWMPPVITEQRVTCIGDCDDVSELLRSIAEKKEGGGYYMLTEYEAAGQGFQWGSDSRLQFYPIVYQFCANWWGAKKVTLENFNEYEKFCGVKLTFQSESLRDLRSLPIDHLTTYDLVLEKLLAKFGKPDGFLRRGQVTIELEDERQGPIGFDRKFRTYRWCPAFDRRLHTPCEASVTLTMDPYSGAGAVLYSTKVLWEYAYSQQKSGEAGDPLFKILHARPR